MTVPILAFDRSMRNYDPTTGHLHIESSNISKACVSPYLGKEIPDSVNLGLDANKVYYLYRDPKELEAAAAAFVGKPILIQHKAINADQHAEDLVVGAVGETNYAHPFLQAALTLWTREAISAVETGRQSQLSCGYGYKAVMTPGVTSDGQKFEGRMTAITPNHLAIVGTGRVGPDVFVADSLPTELSYMTPQMIAALKPFLVADVDLIALDAAVKEGEEACDEDKDDDDKDKPKAKDKKMGKDGKKAADKKGASDEDDENENKSEGKKVSADKKSAKDADPENLKEKARKEIDAADAKTVTLDEMNTAIEASTNAAVERVEALHTARKAVEPICGVVALDSADAVYEFALKHLKVDTKGIPPAAFPAMLALARKPASTPRIVGDAALASGSGRVASIFPAAARARRA